MKRRREEERGKNKIILKKTEKGCTKGRKKEIDVTELKKIIF